MSSMTWLDEHDREIRTAMTALRREWPTLQRWGRRLLDTFDSGGRLLAAGNGGSAAEAQHLTAELVGRFLLERRPFSAICLSAETSSLTAIVNDYGAEEMFARQVQAHGSPGDILLLLSTSGRSPNLLSAAERGRDAGMLTWAITGPGPNPLTARCDESVMVQAPSTAAIQTVHLIAIHGLCAIVDTAVAASPPRIADRPAHRTADPRHVALASELTG
jgi:D-sedoheptulose 7-phosphate isomerase